MVYNMEIIVPLFIYIFFSIKLEFKRFRLCAATVHRGEDMVTQLVLFIMLSLLDRHVHNTVN